MISGDMWHACFSYEDEHTVLLRLSFAMLRLSVDRASPSAQVEALSYQSIKILSILRHLASEVGADTAEQAVNALHDLGRESDVARLLLL